MNGIHSANEGTWVGSLVQEDPRASGQLSLCTATEARAPRDHAPRQERSPPRCN